MISVDLSTGYGIGGLPSTSQRAPLLRLRDASKSPDQSTFLKSQYSVSKTERYFGMTLDTQLTWATHTNLVGRKAAERLGLLGSLLNRRSGLPVRNGVLLYKQLIRPMMD
jgi:hypothetical protein